MIKNKQTLNQLIRYIIIGALTAVVDFGMLYVLGVYLSWNATLSAALAFLAGLVIHFSLNKYFNFKNFDRTSYAQIRTYAVIAIVNFSSTVVFMYILTKYAGIYIMWAKVLTVMINVSWSFPAQKFLTFGRGIRATTYQIWQEKTKKYR